MINDFPESAQPYDRLPAHLLSHSSYIFVLIFVGIAWAVTAFIGWLAIIFTGAYPEGLYNFAVGYMRWSLRVEAYALLLNDEFPPFSLT